MTDSNYTIEVKGAGGASQSGKIDTSDIQKSINQVSADLKKLDTSNFQKSLKDLTQGIQKSATSASNFVANMQKIETKLASTLKAGFSPGLGKSTTENQEKASAKEIAKKVDSDSRKTERLVKTIGSLSDAIDKLTSGIKDNFKQKEKPEEKPEEKKRDVVNDVKKLLAAVGIGSIVKQMAENEFVNPARNAGMLISSNVVSNPGQMGSQLLASYGQRVASNTGNLLGLAGAATALIPGVGLPLAALLSFGGKAAGDILGNTETAPETAIKQRTLGIDYYSNLSRQLPQYGAFAQSQYGRSGFISQSAISDPYFESRAVLGGSYSRFAGGSLSGDTTTGILKSLTAQGASPPQELNISGNLLGQIARFTGKTSVDIEKVYKSVEKSGLSPNEGLQKALSLLQSGLTVKQTTDILQNSSQRTESFSAGQAGYLSSTPFQQFSAQLAGHVTGINQEKFYNGTAAEQAHEAAKVRKIALGANRELRSGNLGSNSITLQELERWQQITPAMADKRLDIAKSTSNKFITPGELQAGVIQDAQDDTNKAAKGRNEEQLVQDTRESILNSTEALKGLGGSAELLSQTFKDAATAIFGSSILATPGVVKIPLVPQARKQ